MGPSLLTRICALTLPANLSNPQGLLLHVAQCDHMSPTGGFGHHLCLRLLIYLLLKP